MGSFIQRKNNVNVPAGIQKDLIKSAELNARVAKVNNFYKL